MAITVERRSAVVTIYQGDYLDRIRDLEARAEAAERAARPVGDDEDRTPTAPRRLSDPPETPEYVQLAREHDALVREAEEHAIHVRVVALKRADWKAMLRNHPPKPDPTAPQDVQDFEKSVGVHEETLKEELVPASVVEPEPGEWIEELSDGDFDRIYLTAFALNRTSGGDPKASLVSRLTTPNAETSS